jgi:hypothetical protein
MMAEDPDSEIPDRYMRALKKMAETVDTMAMLAERDRLSALTDESLGVVESFEPAQLVARLATEAEDNPDERQKLRNLLDFRDDLLKLLESPDANTARPLIRLFKLISIRAMVHAQNAEEALGVDETLMRSHLLNA